jgi:O-antigen/teichoic acid export membrane protein
VVLSSPVGLVAYRAGSEAAAKGVFLIVTVLAARRLTGDGFGVFALGTTLGWLAAVATDLGMQLHLARGVASEPGRAAELLQRWLGLRLASAGFGLAAASIGLAMWGGSGREIATLLLLTLVYLVSSLVEFLHHFYRGLSRSDIESTLTIWQRLGTLVLGTAVLVWSPDVTLLAAALLVPPLATLAYSVRLSSSLAGRSEQSLPSGPATPIGAEFRRDVLPIGAGIVLSALYFRIDVFLIEMWRGIEAVGLYSAAFRLVEALRLLPAAVLAVAFPMLCRATERRPVVRVAAIVTGIGIAVTAAGWAAAGWLLLILYGPAYAGAVKPFQVLLLAFPLMSLNYALTHQLIGWNRHRAYAGLCLTALVFNLTANARLIPVLSIEGAAWTTVATEGVLTLGCLGVLAFGSSFRRTVPGLAPRTHPASAIGGKM